MILVVLPAHLRALAQVRGDVELEVEGPVTQRAVLDALEARYPMLRGTIRDHVTQERRAFLRFFACAEDLSHAPPDAPLPDAVASGAEPLLIIGAIAAEHLGHAWNPSARLHCAVRDSAYVCTRRNLADWLPWRRGGHAPACW